MNQNSPSDLPNDPPATEPSEWSAVVQVIYLASIVLPLSGLIGTILIYATKGSRNPIIKRDARAALNMELTGVLAMLTTLLLVVGTVLITQIAASSPLQSTISPELWAFGSKAVSVGLVTTFLAWSVYRFFASVQNAIATSRGEPAYYRFSLRLIRDVPPEV